jgi:uncharacterized protein (DUF608 family)
MKRSFLLIPLILIILSSCRDVVREYDRVLSERQTEQPVITKRPISYSGDSLKNIAYPIGGIGTGDVLVSGRGNILEWEIFGRAEQDELPPYMTFFAIHAEKPNGDKFNRILEGIMPDDQSNPFGIPRQQLTGIPRFSSCTHQSDFPFARTGLSDPSIPVAARLTTWSPFIPLDTENSSIPVASFDWELKNTGSDTLKIYLAFSFGNPFSDYPQNYKDFSGMATVVKNGNYSGVKFQQQKPLKQGFLVLSPEKNSVVTNRWYKGGWWDDAEVFWKEFQSKGHAGSQVESYNFDETSTVDVATISVPVLLAPGETDTVSFLAAWRIPSRRAEPSMSLGSGQEPGMIYNNYYSKAFNDVEDVADYFYENLDYLYSKTGDFRDLLFAGSYPQYVTDALASNLYALRSNLIMRDSKGTVHAFEGLGNDFGCCPGNCTHVWNYAQSLAFLFPELERDMRETNFLHDTRADGAMSFRTVFPHGDYWMFAEAADGQMGTIMRAYREWKFSGDNEWLKKIWPGIKRALEFAWKGKVNGGIPWDPYREGVIRGNQHNTYDINFFGPNMLTGSLYLGALKSASEMAEALGETQLSEDYLSLYISGREIYDELLWNGEYYEQKVEVLEGISLPSNYQLPEDESGQILPKYQFEKGCLSDQLLGQFLAEVTGMASITDSAHIDRALRSIYRYNFIRNFSEFENIQRVYAFNDESGLVLCTWPGGNKPTVPFVYSDEVWTGVEYQVAASLIYRDMVSEGLELVKAVRERYRGFNRNPYAEIESGRYYARSLANWALLTALSGYSYNGVEKSLVFRPKINQHNFFSFWSTAKGWGSFEIKNKALFLKVWYGELELSEFAFEHDSQTIQEISVPGYSHESRQNFHRVIFDNTLRLKEGDNLEIGMKGNKL